MWARAKEVLQWLRRYSESDDSGWVFPGHKGRHAGAALGKMLEVMGGRGGTRCLTSW